MPDLSGTLFAVNYIDGQVRRLNTLCVMIYNCAIISAGFQ